MGSAGEGIFQMRLFRQSAAKAIIGWPIYSNVERLDLFQHPSRADDKGPYVSNIHAGSFPNNRHLTVFWAIVIRLLLGLAGVL